MQNNTKTKVLEAFRTGKSSNIKQALLDFYREQNFYRKPAYTKSTVPLVFTEPEDNIITVANEIFGGDFTERSTTP